MKKAFNLFLISLTIVILSFLTASFWGSLGLGEDYRVLAASLIFSMLLSSIGFIIGLIEYQSHKTKKVLTAIVGNALIVLSVIGIVAYSLSGF